MQLQVHPSHSGRSLGRLREIGEEAFRDCQRLREAVLNWRLEEVGRSAFCGCSRLQRLGLARWSRLRRVGEHAFGGTLLVAGGVRFPARARVSGEAFAGIE